MAEQMLGRKFTLEPTNEVDEAQDISKTVMMDKISIRDLEKAGINVENKPVIREVRSFAEQGEQESMTAQQRKVYEQNLLRRK